MPRFSDVFSYFSADDNGHVFTKCYLLKRVGKFDKGARIDNISFDIAGLLLYFEVSGEPMHGPFCLTTE
jgi:hypothetical protein